jgi:hypothetical protein
MPILKEVAPSDARQPEVTVYELRKLVVAPEAVAAGAAQGEAQAT